MKVLTLIAVLFLSFFLFFLTPSHSSQWVNPKDALGDPDIARLQNGGRELTDLEKEEIKKYGHTGLEIMTYLFDNKHPGLKDSTYYHRCLTYNGRSINVSEWLDARKYYYKNMVEKLRDMKPGQVEYKKRNLCLSPSNIKGLGSIQVHYLESEKFQRDWEEWGYLPKQRRDRRNPAPNRQEEYANMITTRDDDRTRNPWEEEHRIIGEDAIRGQECFVIESKHKKPDYYLSKRVVWVEKKNFIDLHEEHFDRKGILYKVFDMDWLQFKPGNYWVVRETNVVRFPLKQRTIHQTPSWVVDQGLTDEDFNPRLLANEQPWVDLKVPLPPVKKLEDFPPEPKIRWEFWNKIGVKPPVISH